MFGPGDTSQWYDDNGHQPYKYLTSIVTEPRPENGGDNDKAFNDDDDGHISNCPHLVDYNESDHDLI